MTKDQSRQILPDLIDLDELLRDVPPLKSPQDWAAPEIMPDDGEFKEFLAWLRGNE